MSEKTIHWIKHSRLIRFLIWMIFNMMSFAIPSQRLRETENLLAFFHPQPDYPFHAIIVPKKPAATLIDLDPNDPAFLTDLYATAQSLVKEYHLADDGYRLIVNGGKYQTFPYLHFHLISEQKPFTTKDTK
jgi:histidine triad (HIT) family protein